MRKLMWFTIGIVLACVVCAYGLMNPWLPPAMAAAVFGSIIVLILSGRKRYFRPAAAVLLGCVIGILWYGLFYDAYIHPVRLLDGREVRLSVTATDYSRITDYGAVVDGTTVLDGKPIT